MPTRDNEGVGLRTEETLDIGAVFVEGRVRKEFGDIDSLANSIRENGLIQPLVLARQEPPLLIAGERRLRALKRLGISLLVHARHFVWKDEVNQYQIKSMELEENLKRLNLTWQEEVLAKKRLLEIQQELHGVAGPGRPGSDPGFGINKLAAMLGESNAQTSKDVELARLIEAVPQLAKAETKEAARRQASLSMTVAIALAQNKANPPKTEAKWTLYQGDFVTNVNNIEPGTIDLVIVDPPYGEDSQGMGPNSKALLATAFADGYAETVTLLTDLAQASYRVLKDARFAAFFFGFRVYSTLVSQLIDVGFTVDTTPLIWVKNSVVNTDPYRRYGRSYEPILLCRKGEAKLMRPSQRDVIAMDNVITRGTQELKLYQAQKPVALIEKLILDLTPPQSAICDFCAGSGTAGEAALRNGRRAILFEKDPTACSIIKARLGGL
jgi:DNA modification methylase